MNFHLFVQSIYLYCKKHGIEPNMIFAWIADLNYFKPMISTLSVRSNLSIIHQIIETITI